MLPHESPTQSYDVLRNRAHDYVVEHGGTVRELDLIEYIFGAAGKPALWRTLLIAVLASDGRFLQTADGTWALSTPIQQVDFAVSFVALDVETTGLRPEQHRVIEVGLARYANGRCMDRYSALINPGRRIPDYIRKLTGISDSDLIPAPSFRDLASTICEFVGDNLIVGHNIGFDIGFINAELGRADMPALTNPTLDTIPMSMRVLGRRVRPSLDRVANALGMPPRTLHRALGDAELTAAVAMRLLPLAHEQGIGFEEFVKYHKAGMKVAAPPRLGSPATLDRSFLDDLPRRPGVYLMYDADGNVLYVGKAKSLRDRVASYYSQPLGYTRKMDGLIENIRRIEHEETGSELVALLLESQLIRRHEPPYNRMLRNAESYPYIRLDVAAKWPRLRLAKKPSRDGAIYFGPFRSRTTARDAIVLLSRRFKLRTCARSFKTPASYGNPCLELDLHRCPGPCVGRADPDEYRGGVNAVLELLSSSESQLLSQLETEINLAVQNEAFEVAQRLRNEQSVFARLQSESQLLRDIRGQLPYCIIQRGPDEGTVQVLLIIHGRWWAQVVAPPEDQRLIANRLNESWRRFTQVGFEGMDHHGVDEANIIARWRNLPNSDEFVVIVAESDPDWFAIAGEIATRLRNPGPMFTPVVASHNITSQAS